MGFWSNIGLEENESVSQAQQELVGTYGNLPTDEVNASHGKCETCNKESVLGNGLCVKCWDFVVDNSSSSSSIWPNAQAHRNLTSTMKHLQRKVYTD